MPKRSSITSGAANDIAASLLKAMESGRMPMTQDGKNPLAVALGRMGGLKGGKARAAKLSSQERSAIARRAAQMRWADKDSE